MASSPFSRIVKSLWVVLAFIPFLNGLGFAYIGAKEFNSSWIKEGLVYEIPWFLEFIFLGNDSLASLFAGLGLIFMLISIVRTLMVYYKHKDVLIDDDPESKLDIEKSFNSYWVVFSVIIFLNGLGLILVGLKRNVRRWIVEGIFFELLWTLTFALFLVKESLGEFFISISIIGMILSIIITFMVYFEEERMDDGDFHFSALDSTQKTEDIQVPSINESSDAEVIPQFISYNEQINDLKESFNQKEDNINNLINSRFNEEELTYDRFTSVIKNCHKLFYHQANSALSIIHLAPEYSMRLDESIKGKIYIMEGIIDEMNNLIEELILHDGDDKQSEDDLNELFANMDNLINSVKDYK